MVKDPNRTSETYEHYYKYIFSMVIWFWLYVSITQRKFNYFISMLILMLMLD